MGSREPLPFVSVIIPSYNLAGYLEIALDSVSRQTHRHWEALVVDDCSTDNSFPMAEAYARSRGDERIKVLRPAQNGGVSRARNLGLEQAAGDWLGLLDADDLWDDDFLERMLRAGDANPGVVCCGVRLIDGAGNPYGEDPVNPSEEEIADFPRSLLLRNYLPPAATLMHRSVFERIGYFDETPEIQHVEDWDIWMRCIQAGIPFARISDYAGCGYRVHSDNATRNTEKMLRRKIALYRKHCGLPALSPGIWRRQLAEFHRTLGFLLARSGRGCEGIGHGLQCLRYTPLDPKALLSPWHIACARAMAGRTAGSGEAG